MSRPAQDPGTLIGYACSLAGDPPLDDLVRQLEAAGCARVFTDELPDRKAGRPELGSCLDELGDGDVLVVVSLDQLSGSLRGLISTVAGLRERRAGFRSLQEALDTTVPGGHHAFGVFTGLAQFNHGIRAAETRAGLVRAGKQGRRPGRPRALDGNGIRRARDLLAQPGATVTSVAVEMGLARQTIYNHLEEITGSPQPVKVMLSSHMARPGRQALVAVRLADLRGPVSGQLELPLRVFWSGPGVFNLDDLAQLRLAYENVLREAISAEELALLNGAKLAEVWPDLFLPKGVRRAWEEQHAVLRQEAA